MRRWIEPELLDGQIEDSPELHENLRDMARANRLLLSNRGVLRRVEAWAARVPAHLPITIIDVATGAGELPRAIAAWARDAGRCAHIVASDREQSIAAMARRESRGWPIDVARHDALHMPFADASVDIVTCAFALHHFSPPAAAGLLREMARVARIGVIVTDLRRSYAAHWGARLLAIGVRNRLSRHDGPLSVLRAYTPREVEAIMTEARLRGMVRAESFFRLVITVEKACPPAHA